MLWHKAGGVIAPTLGPSKSIKPISLILLLKTNTCNECVKTRWHVAREIIKHNRNGVIRMRTVQANGAWLPVVLQTSALHFTPTFLTVWFFFYEGASFQCNSNFGPRLISPLMCNWRRKVNRLTAVESSRTIHVWSCSHSKAGKVICEIRRLASENLWRREGKPYTSCGYGQHSFHMVTLINKLPLFGHLGAPRYSKLVKPTSVVRYVEN